MYIRNIFSINGHKFAADCQKLFVSFGSVYVFFLSSSSSCLVAVVCAGFVFCPPVNNTLQAVNTCLCPLRACHDFHANQSSVPAIYRYSYIFLLYIRFLHSSLVKCYEGTQVYRPDLHFGRTWLRIAGWHDTIRTRWVPRLIRWTD